MVVRVYNNIKEEFSPKNEGFDVMNILKEIPEGEYTERIYRENAYILLSVLCAMSNSMNLSGNSQTVCRIAQELLREEVGEEELTVNLCK